LSVRAPAALPPVGCKRTVSSAGSSRRTPSGRDRWSSYELVAAAALSTAAEYDDDDDDQETAPVHPTATPAGRCSAGKQVSK